MKKQIILLFLFFSFFQLKSQTYFSGSNNISVAKTLKARCVYAADINGDNNIDVISASFDDDKISWYENIDGLGTIGNQKNITTHANGAISIFAADFDGDNDMDILSASYNDDKIAWYENIDGLGTFGSEQTISINADGAMSVFAADIDNDGDMDIVSASALDFKIAWYENTDGIGTFGTQQIITTDVINVWSIYVADIDGDGDNDVLSASKDDNKIAWYENTDGAGTFSSQIIITTNVSEPRSVFADDIDGDGDIDVLSASYSDDKIAWYENTDGLGTFSTQNIISSSVNGAYNIFTTDFDGDGDKDVLSAAYADDKIYWHENDGLGTFSSQHTISSSIDGVISVFATDIDNDGDKDVLSASLNDNKVLLFKNTDGLGTFSNRITISPKTNGAYCVYAADLDSDGDYDVISASYTDKIIAWYENTDGLGSFGPQIILASDVTGARSVYATDIDNDGDIDIMSASSSRILWFENTDGLGTFSSQKIVTTNVDGATSVYAGDIDGDNDIDIISGSYYSRKIEWYENTDGLGTFTTHNISMRPSQCVYASDIDNDGDLDVFSASRNPSDQNITWYENLYGTGQFGSKQVIASDLYSAYSVTTSDINGDGNTDVVWGYYSGLKWSENTDGLGTFGNGIYVDSNRPRALYSTDIDGDGDMDILSAYESTTANSGRIYWFENTDGLGSFASKPVISNAPNAKSVFAADINGDGDIDVLSASNYDNRIAWYENYTLKITEQPTNKEICQSSNTLFSITAKNTTEYQWQVNEGSNFIDLTDNSMYSGVSTETLQISNATYEMNNYNYRCILSNPGGSKYSDTTVLTVNPLTEIISQPESETTCVGTDDLIMEIEAIGANITYQWYKNGSIIPGETNSTYIITRTTLNSGTYTCTVSSDCGSDITSTDAIITISETEIISQPQSSIIICENSQDIILETITNITDGSYQWYKDGEIISGAENSTYTISSIILNSGTYYCSVSDDCNNVLTTDDAVVIINPATDITSQPNDFITVCEGEDISLAIEANGTNLTYQWYKNGEMIPDAENSNYSINSIPSNSGIYYCIVTGECGSIQTSDNSDVTINPLTEIITQPTSTIVCENEDYITLYIDVIGNNLTYQWYKDGYEIWDATNSIYNLSNELNNSGIYTCTVSGNCGNVTSEEAEVIINPQTEIYYQTTITTEVCENSDNINLEVYAEGSNITYQWYLNFNPINGATNTSFSVETLAENSGIYNCIISGDCEDVISNESYITINPATTINTQPISQENINFGEDVYFSIDVSGINLSYQWIKDAAGITEENITGIYTNELSINSAVIENAGTYVCYIFGGCGLAISNGAILSFPSDIKNLSNKDISIYPNPTNGIINCNFFDKSIDLVSITDITGKTIIEKVNINNKETFNISEFENGIYFMFIYFDNKILSTKIIKE